MRRNRPRIFSTNSRMEGGVFVHSWFIRGWSFGTAAVGGWGGRVRGGGGSGPRGEAEAVCVEVRV
jgi:hypothetical protein